MADFAPLPDVPVAGPPAFFFQYSGDTVLHNAGLDLEFTADGRIGVNAEQLGQLAAGLSDVDVVWFVPGDPFSDALIPKMEIEPEPVLTFMDGRLSVDPNRREITVDGRVIEPKKREFDLLYFLVRNQGRILDRLTLYEAIWGDTIYRKRDTNLNVHIYRIRRHLGPELRDLVKGVSGVGYMFRDPTHKPEEVKTPALHLLKEQTPEGGLLE